jgi:drug/metabolite transporter (DMT)-like permease
VLSVVLALGSSACWGVADFVGGLLARRRPLMTVLLVSQVAGITVALVLAVAAGDGAPSGRAAAWAAGAGALGVLALAAFYRGLAIGTMSIVAPIAATGAVVPVLVGVVRGERPATLQVVGICLALAGIVLAAREPRAAPGARAARASIGLALVAALGFGSFFVGVDEATAGASVPWTILVVRTAEVCLLLAAAAAVRPRLPRRAVHLAALASVGLLDTGANALYAFATTKGLLSVVSVLGSLYPAMTVVLARVVLGERVARVQGLGVLAALAGVVAISAG